jgi:SAM-dependent methyltransferase
MGLLLDRRFGEELKLASVEPAFWYEGVCALCRGQVRFLVSTEGGEPVGRGRVLPSWREQLKCERCRLTNRERALAHALTAATEFESDARVLVLGPKTDLNPWLEGRFDSVEAAAAPDDGELDLPPSSIDAMVAPDTLHRIENVDRLFREAVRVLGPGGKLLFSAPLDYEAQDSTVAAVATGGAAHQFGWDLLDRLKAAGFLRAHALFYWSQELAYLGPFNFVFIASKI